ncbi:MAG: argininosuccinate lyase [Omnitrophica bacterium RIFCSPLOWO2_12_FULL_44_17]|uniref:Argininosuccinate lyase n=1 Tax=Candidatus Danuiimicrobium aquiferis TaxID=1801832 RepID=A0A1G1L1M3_9BACT|nr:MAG: argininosuccinate lyase [Omnitrophica bacterium RIFCSPHIGHO2_02_FULL_45_28]OGW90417.1 MAG: argininosuccinate lyase [Omnitrophica bacterium RIFCSPHIGHO2_12_FULL_44_12]OGW99036.1 MAG: argininosuccinate lyase [Omnitrophica bacterium RIFCSPLOWO2_12_FULL_44_17]OGX04112.1 MAG: argininosuccinate lyase [Omnitrophica bacterium RIFCSPLOWO2_02_FULL_44_11]
MKKLWGGRFKTDLDPVAKKFSYSLAVDCELLDAELYVTAAHVLMLAKVGILSKREAKAIVDGLWKTKETLNKTVVQDVAQTCEDVHTLIEMTLTQKIGSMAKKIHTARSRNDLVATSTRLYVKEKIHSILEGINSFQSTLVAQADRYADVVIPGYTHLQRAQVVPLSHHLLAYVEMLERDKSRFLDALKRLNECPLGAGAIAGSGLPIDRTFVSKLLGFERPTANSIDSVSDRDFVVEVTSCVAVAYMHLSRFAEDLILWNSQEFGFIELDDRFATGSSLMPHKKNPDMLELTRGKTGEAYGNLISVLVTMKGLPLAYNRDMQQDKKPLFASLKMFTETLDVLSGTVKTFKVDKNNCKRACNDSFLFATDVLEYLVKKEIPFREAHELVGRLVRYASESNTTLGALTLETYKKYSEAFEKDVFDLFDPLVSVNSKVSTGSANPELVKAEMDQWKVRLKSEKTNLKKQYHITQEAFVL